MTTVTTTPTPAEAIAELQRECGYPEDYDTPATLDNLIDYKDALEDAHRALLAQVEAIRENAAAWAAEYEADSEYWELVASGQDTEEAETSGHLDGWTAAIDRVYAYLTGSGELLDPGTYSRERLAAHKEA